jgi:hypothetical protein
VPDEAEASFATLGTAIVNIVGSSSADAVLVSQSGTQLVISFTNGETGITTTQTFALGTITKVNFFGQSGDDKLTIDNGGALLSLEVNYDGGLGTDTLHLRAGTALSETLTAGQAEDTGSITLNGTGGVLQTINYNDIGQIIDTVFAENFTITANNKQQPIEILNGSSRDEFTTTRVTGIHRDHKATICYHTGSAKNPAVLITIGRPAVDAHMRNHGDEILSDEPATTPIEFANKTNVTINGSNGSDSFLLNHPTAAAGLQKLTIDGQNGKDTLSKVALAAAVELVLASIERQ